MAVFPETMDRLDAQNVRKSLDRIERYISYMTERVEHANRKSEKTMEELLTKIATLETKITALEKRLEEPEATLAEQEESVVPAAESETTEEQTEVPEEKESNEGGA